MHLVYAFAGTTLSGKEKPVRTLLSSYIISNYHCISIHVNPQFPIEMLSSISTVCIYCATLVPLLEVSLYNFELNVEVDIFVYPFSPTRVRAERKG